MCLLAKPQRQRGGEKPLMNNLLLNSTGKIILLLFGVQHTSSILFFHFSPKFQVAEAICRAYRLCM